MNLEDMSEMELRARKQEKYWEQQALKRNDYEGYTTLREEMLVIQDAMEAKQLIRYEEYIYTALTTPGAISTVVGGALATAESGAPAPRD